MSANASTPRETVVDDKSDCEERIKRGARATRLAATTTSIGIMLVSVKS